jgi:hypothetical protein
MYAGPVTRSPTPTGAAYARLVAGAFPGPRRYDPQPRVAPAASRCRGCLVLGRPVEDPAPPSAASPPPPLTICCCYRDRRVPHCRVGCQHRLHDRRQRLQRHVRCGRHSHRPGWSRSCHCHHDHDRRRCDGVGGHGRRLPGSSLQGRALACAAHDRRGRPLQPGDIVMSGALGPMRDFPPGSTALATSGGLGCVSVTRMEDSSGRLPLSARATSAPT